MSAPSNPGAAVYTQGFGSAPLSALGIIPVTAPFSPAATNIQGPAGIYQAGQFWINTLANSVYLLTSLVPSNGQLTATWVEIASSSGVVTAVVGTAGEIAAAAVGGVTTLSLPAAVTAPGSITSGTTLTATTGNITATNGNLVLGTAGNKLVIAAGTNGSTGTTAAMTGTPGTVTTASTAVTTSSIILFARRITGGTEGNVSITAQSAGSFTLTSTGNETSTFNYLIIN